MFPEDVGLLCVRRWEPEQPRVWSFISLSWCQTFWIQIWVFYARDGMRVCNDQCLGELVKIKICMHLFCEFVHWFQSIGVVWWSHHCCKRAGRWEKWPVKTTASWKSWLGAPVTFVRHDAGVPQEWQELRRRVCTRHRDQTWRGFRLFHQPRLWCQLCSHLYQPACECLTCLWYIHAHMYVRMHAHSLTHSHSVTHPPVYEHTQLHTHSNTWACSHTHTHTNTCACTHTLHAHKHTHAVSVSLSLLCHVCTHACKHTHTCTQVRAF